MFTNLLKIHHRNWLNIVLASASRNVSRMCEKYLTLRRSMTTDAKPVTQDSFLTCTSGSYIEDMYHAWLKDPKSVHASWDSYFKLEASGCCYQPPPSLSVPGKNEIPFCQIRPLLDQNTAQGPTTSEDKRLLEHYAIKELIRSYQMRGHLYAQLDPLSINVVTDPKERLEKVSAGDYNFTDADLDRSFRLPPKTRIGGSKTHMTLKEIIDKLDQTYCSHIGAEYMYLNEEAHTSWIMEKLESSSPPSTLDVPAKKLLWKRLKRATLFESFLAKKWSSEKRFGLEGCEVLIPAMKQIIDKSTLLDVDNIAIGMAHRGRLNVLANVCRKPLHQIFTQFAGLAAIDEGSGDVKYHLGTNIQRLNRATNKMVRLAVVANPSHLEAVNPVVLGKVKATQFYNCDSTGTAAMAMLLHGDAAFSGQGVVFESMHLSDLPCYSTFGTIHIVINNQIGFTTDPRFCRSSPHCTDVARVVNAPIFHVNADDPEAVIFVCDIAAEYRAKFHKDVVIDLVCYRRFGHNEVDEPMFTQPLVYTKIREQKPIYEAYTEKLLAEGAVQPDEIKATNDEYEKILEEDFEKAKQETHVLYKEWLDSPWTGFFEGKNLLKLDPTGVNEETLKNIATKFSSPPPPEAKFQMHKGLERILKGRMELVANRQIDWAIGEALAFGTLLKEGIHVRLSGQDVERGTFSHRHHVLHHQTVDMVTYNALTNLYPDQAKYVVCNSSLSEYAVLGFELGFSMTNPCSLVCWEAQFGDFCNVAQCIIDQFICSGQSKWVRQSGLVLLLPHGMEGMGPEHSSGRLERFLQMSSDDADAPFSTDEEYNQVKHLLDTNWIVANCSTPANLFHILRRQVLLPFRKPLILMTPKAMLRHPLARSCFDEMLEDTCFARLIPDCGEVRNNPTSATKLIFCTGKTYFDLFDARKEAQLEDKIVLNRIEQICPFPYDLVQCEIARYCNAEVFWAQEEHKNHGAWSYVQPRLNRFLAASRVTYIGRPSAAYPATGSKAQHLREQDDYIKSAMSI